MNLEDAIRHAEEVASRMFDDRVHCIKCAEEHRQLAEWLRDYKRLKEQEPKTEKVIKMRDATPEEQKSVNDYIKNISKPTGIDFDEEQEQLDFVQPHKRIPVTLMVSGDLISRQEAIDTIRQLYIDLAIQKYVIDILKALPSIKPQTGHWIYIGNGHNGLNKCSECGGERKMFDGLEKYCASCGCRMVKPQETKQPEISSFYGLKSYVRERSEE